MTATPPAAGDSRKAACRIASCVRAGRAVRPACSSCRPPSWVRRRGADRQRGRHRRFPVRFLQRPTGQGGRRSARRLDRGDDLRPDPASHSAPLTSPCGRGRWLIGQLVDELCLARVRSGTLVTFRRYIPRRCAQPTVRSGCLPSRLRRAIPDSWNRRLNGKSMHRWLGSPRLSHWEATCHTRRARRGGRSPCSLQRPHDGRSASGGHL
jgi:hypothetical protein